MNLTKLFKEFFESERAGGILLLICTVFSLALANSSFGSGYLEFWQIKVVGGSIVHWINDGLMAVFFLLIGLELEREIYKGELSNIKDSLLPIFAAIGGMIVPASIYLIFNFGSDASSGAGIPMATDIAFALGILSLLGNRVPSALKVFLTATAVIDDLGAILIIAFFYSKSLVFVNLIIAIGIFIILLILNRLKVYNIIPYIIGGLVMWYFMHYSGVHATITGVLLAFAIPFGKNDETSPSYKMQHFLHYPVAFFILPLFALANTAFLISGSFLDIFSQNYSIGIILGLIVGKPVGIFLFSYLCVIIGISKLPTEINWKSIIGVGFLAGIGFTMSIFITLLAFENNIMIINSKLAILVASLISGIIGYFFLKFNLKVKLI